MKFLSYILFGIILFVSSGCNKDESNTNQSVNSGLIGTWNAISSSGGFAGANCLYQLGEVVLVFDSENNLTVTNEVLNTTALCGGQEIGMSVSTHTYGVLESEEKDYLFINDIELGEIVLNTNEFTLNQNSYSSGSGADGYFITFTK